FRSLSPNNPSPRKREDTPRLTPPEEATSSRSSYFTQRASISLSPNGQGLRTVHAAVAFSNPHP
ncbi:MAG: hypothetical protein AAGI66_10080, partial [Cyanobacteria bacterium P01_H01_bin.74]